MTSTMNRSTLDTKDQLLDHLRKRERFSDEQTSTIVCPLPVTLMGEYYYDITLSSAVDLYCIFTYFRNSSNEIKLYCIDIPGIYRIKTGKTHTDKKDKITRFATEAAISFEKKYGLNTGFTGVMSTPFLNLNELQIKLCVYLALLTINSDRDHLSANGFIIKESDGLPDTAKLIAATQNRKNSIVYVGPTDEEADHRLISNSIEDLNLVVVIAGPFSGQHNDCVNSATYSKVLSLMSAMSSRKQIMSFSSITPEIFRTNISRLPSDLRQAAIFYYQDIHMVSEAAKYWENNDIESFGAVLSKSSLSECMTNGNERLASIIRKIDSYEGVYGTALGKNREYIELYILTKEGNQDSVINRIEQEISTRFQTNPEIRSANICDGIKIV